MIVTSDISQIADLDTPVHLAMGVFDGVHCGHQEVIQKVVKAAHEKGELSGVLTFDPFPIQVVAPDRAPQKILATIEHKQKLLAELGVDFLLVIPFDMDFAKLSASAFLDLLCNSGKVTHISVGEDWKFGRGREGKLNFLKTYCEENEIALSATAPVIHEGERISSTRIRQAVRDGNLKTAAVMLGRSYSLFGEVVKGQQLGRKIGFPTANVDTKNELLPPNGVYVVNSVLNGEVLRGVANLGVRPTISGGKKRSFEVHFFDFSDEIYGVDLEVKIGHFMRPEKKFENLDELKRQIRTDCEAASQFDLFE